MFDYEGERRKIADERTQRSPALVAAMEIVAAKFVGYRGYRFEDLAQMRDVRVPLMFPGVLDQVLAALVRDYALVREVQWSGIWYSRTWKINGGPAKVRNSRGVSFRVGNRARCIVKGYDGREGVVVEVDPAKGTLVIAHGFASETGFYAEDMELE